MHQHELKYDGKVVHSTDPDVIGMESFVCDCGTSVYSERIEPSGKIIIKPGARRMRADDEKRKAGK